MARRTERAGRAGVNVYTGLPRTDIGHFIDVRSREFCAAAAALTGRAAADAGRAKGLELEGVQCAICFCTELDFLETRRTIADRQGFIEACQHEFDRRFGLLRQSGSQSAFGSRTKLCAESAAHKFGNDMDLVLRNLEAACQTIPDAGDTLS